MTDLLLVRHADSGPPTVGGPDEYHRPLSTLGREQAELLASYLTGRWAPSRIFSSPYLRAVQTVEPGRVSRPGRRGGRSGAASRR